MAVACPLIAVGILERDNFAETMCSWCYPTLGDLEPVVLARSRMDEDEVSSSLLFSKFNNTWIYILPVINSNSRNMASVQVFSIALVSKAYGEAGDPLKVLEGFLSVFAKGGWEAKNSQGVSLGRFAESEYDARMPLLQSSVKALVAQLGQESIFLWSALLCKKRVVMYSSSVEKLQHAVRATPLLVWHRNSTWQSLRPLVNLESTVELADLKTSKVYIAGFTDDSVRNREDLFDLFVDLDAGSFKIAEHAQNEFLLCNVHKDMAGYLMEAANDGDVEDHQAMIKGMCVKTKNVLAKLDSLKTDHGLGKPTIAREDLEPLGGKNLDTFLWQVAIAEDMCS